ncbi:MAG TPA: DUF1631 family protein, partial [Burkholderiaceae bacterium]|nr:DUF1631 family protein [Burkholderiaceae bacterium]
IRLSRTMPHRPTLAEFLDQELRLSEAALAAIVDGVLKQWRDRATLRSGGATGALRVLHSQRSDFIARAQQSLYNQAAGRRDSNTGKPSAGGRLELSLVDDEEVTADIEIARIVERSNAELEEALRELRTYTSALVGDVNTARDTNPLRPEVWVRAVHAGARSLPIERSLQTDLLRCAAQPLIQTLRDGYAAACSRLHALGIVPALYRTVVNEGVVTELTEAMRARRALDRGPDHDPFADAMHGSYEHNATERLSRLYERILADRRLPRDSQPLLERLYPAVLQRTLRDPDLLTDPGDPVWRFIDQLGFLVQTRMVGSQQTNLAFAQELVDQLASQHSTDSRPFQTAANRLIVHERQRFARAVAAAAADIALLSARLQDPKADPAVTLPQSLDPGGVDPYRPPLRRGEDDEPESDAVVDAWRAGSWVSIFLRGQWRRVLVLWRAPIPGPLLLLDANESRHWAVPSAAIELLAAAGLARVFAPRSLMSDAVNRSGPLARDPGPSLFG